MLQVPNTTEASPTARTRSRRRFTIAALALLLLCGGLWWSTRPTIDPRLLGTWTYVRTNDRQVPTQRRFDADGLAYLIRNFEPPGSAQVTRFRWRVVDREIQLLPFHGSDWHGLLKSLVERINELRGIQPEIIRFQVVEIADTTLKMQQFSSRSSLPAANYVRAPDNEFIIR